MKERFSLDEIKEELERIWAEYEQPKVLYRSCITHGILSTESDLFYSHCGNGDCWACNKIRESQEQIVDKHGV